MGASCASWTPKTQTLGSPRNRVNFIDALPSSAQTEIVRFLAVDGGAWPAASDAAVKTFASLPEQAALVEEWGRDARKKLGIVRGRMGLMLNAMTPEDRSAADAWFDALPASQAVAVLRALAG